MRKRLTGLGLAILRFLLPAASGGSVLGAVIASYDAGQGANPPHPVSAAGWMEAFTSPAFGSLAYPVENDLGSGTNAWQVADQSPSPSNPVYFQNLAAAHVQEGIQKGWQFRMRSRYVFDFSDGPNLGLTASVGGRRYSLMLDLAPNGALSATLNDSIPRTHLLTAAGAGPLAYHDYTLTYAPIDGTASFYFDGLLVDQWTGIGDLLGDTIFWGNPSGASQRGVINFNQVVFETDPHIVGDYNGDKKVDEGDYSAWREAIGDFGPSPADGSGNNVVDAADYVLWRHHFQNLTAGQLHGQSDASSTLGRDLDVQGAASGVQLGTTVEIPEPPMSMLLGAGMASIVATPLRRSRRKKTGRVVAATGSLNHH